MDTLYWIIFVFFSLFLTNPTSGQSEVEVHLTLKKYVDRGLSVTIFCEHNVKHDILYKVLWLKADHGKLFEYVRVRNAPFRNFSIPGAEIDWTKTDETKLSLKKLEFEASGHYYCEVSTDTPIFTKASQEEPLHVIAPQSGPPAIKFKRKPPFYIGDQLQALCNTTVARPIPHITWLINGKKVPSEFLRPVNVLSKIHKNKTHKQSGSHQSKHQFQQLKLIHQQQQQQQTQHQQQQLPHMKNNPPLLDRNSQQQLEFNNNNNNNYNNNNNNEKMPSLRGFNSHGFNSWQEELPHQQYHHNHREGHHHGGSIDGIGRTSNIYNTYSQHTNEHETNHRNNYDNKYYEIKKHSRNSFNRKYRRHLNDNYNNGYNNMRRNGGGGGGSSSSTGNYGNSSIINDAAYSIQATINNGGFGNLNSNSEGSGYGSGFLSTGSIGSSSIGSGGGSITSSNSNSHINEATSKYHSHIPYNGTYAMSGMQIEITEEHINSHGRLEITCLATIPAHVAPGEQYADYKTHSVKIDVERRPKPLPNKTTFDQQATPQVPDGLAQLANNNSSSGVSINRVLPINIILSCLTILRV